MVKTDRYTVFLAPDLMGGLGGIARVCLLCCRALTEADEHFVTVALHDKEDDSQKASAIFPHMAYVPCRGSRFKFVFQAAVEALRRRPAVIFAAHPYFSYVTYFIARMVGARSVVMIHGLDAWARLPWLRRWALQRVDTVISVSQFTADRAARANDLAVSKITVVHNCLDPDLPAAPSTNGADSKLSLLTVARIKAGENKGHEEVIRALPELLSRFPNLKYSIVGDGDGRPGLEQLALAEGVSDAVMFHGTVSEQDLARHYAEASLFIMPSRGEGFGLAFIEAMAFNKPAIGGNVDAAAEVIIDNETGYLVDPGSTAQIVDRVSKLLSNQSLLESMGREGAAHVRRSFSYEAFKKNLLAALFDGPKDGMVLS